MPLSTFTLLIKRHSQEFFLIVISVIGGSFQKLTGQSYAALLYAVTNRKNGVSSIFLNKLEPQCDFLERNPVWYTKRRAKYINCRIVDQKKKIAKQKGISSFIFPWAEQ